ncbi:SRPBCC domain-containing protein [Aliisedimentitalea scapharcae]|uniref:SRPBCC domain-containing protein n=1 Tax=Aliisedimentitalea scapharcae TaxID=1524259 RepID=A0ABZ2XTS5_9RHOB|nr:SRPBCC domain-containing protein [Rhodobacteraceae bacterium M382]
MTDLRLERDFPVTPDRLYVWLTDPAKLLQWWGPEGMTIGEHDLNLTKPGPWLSVMVGDDSGQKFKVSGQVTHVDPPKSVGFTWGWHDDQDQRGPESHVTFSVSETATGARLTIDHRDLDDSEMSASHERGWSSALSKLTAKLN